MTRRRRRSAALSRGRALLAGNTRAPTHGRSVLLPRPPCERAFLLQRPLEERERRGFVAPPSSRRLVRFPAMNSAHEDSDRCGSPASSGRSSASLATATTSASTTTGSGAAQPSSTGSHSGSAATAAACSKGRLNRAAFPPRSRRSCGPAPVSGRRRLRRRQARLPTAHPRPRGSSAAAWPGDPAARSAWDAMGELTQGETLLNRTGEPGGRPWERARPARAAPPER